MMNKGLELIEAIHLFGVDESQIEIVIHPQSIIHSAVEFEDSTVIAQMSVPDMRLPIQYALTYPERLPSAAERLSLTDIERLTFIEPDYDAFSCLALAREAARLGGNAPCALNAANEAAVSLFLNDEIAFYEIPGAVEKVFSQIEKTRELSLDIIENTEAKVKEKITCLY
jgi:1-deoxy-D-xylulose-5-phosphate reductoisomerase